MPEKSHLKIINDGGEILIDIPKKYDSNQLIGMMIVIFVVLGFNVLLYWLQNYSNVEDSGNLLIFHIIFKGFGVIMILGMIHALLSREFIKIKRSHLVIGTRFMGLRTRGRHYEWHEIKALKRAPEPERKWKIVREYDGGGHRNIEFTYDYRKVYPTLEFIYNHRAVLFASGLNNSDIDLLLTTIGDCGYVKN